MTITSILWRRLDVPGHDACSLRSTASGWELEGTAVFREEGVPASLRYRLACDSAWRTIEGSVYGWIGADSVSLEVQHRPDGAWTLNGATVPGLDVCLDLDFGITPATNLAQLRRVALEVGQGADVPVAWLDPASASLSLLHQRYERRAQGTYWYDAPRFAYTALLEIDSNGFARNYPGLWEIEP